MKFIKEIMLVSQLSASSFALAGTCTIFEQAPYPAQIEYMRNQVTGPVKVKMEFSNLSNSTCRSWRYFANSYQAEISNPGTVSFIDPETDKVLLQSRIHKLTALYETSKSTGRVIDDFKFLIDIREVSGIWRIGVDTKTTFSGGKLRIRDNNFGKWIDYDATFLSQ